MRAAKAVVVYSHNRLRVIDHKDEYDPELFPFSIRLDDRNPCRSLLTAFVQLTKIGLTSAHVTRELLVVEEFHALFGVQELHKRKRWRVVA
jgi:hypothetical protein